MESKDSLLAGVNTCQQLVQVFGDDTKIIRDVNLLLHLFRVVVIGADIELLLAISLAFESPVVVRVVEVFGNV